MAETKHLFSSWRQRDQRWIKSWGELGEFVSNKVERAFTSPGRSRVFGELWLRCCWTSGCLRWCCCGTGWCRTSFIVTLPLLSTSHEKYPTEGCRLFCGAVQLGSCGWICEVRHAFIVQCEWRRCRQLLAEVTRWVLGTVAQRNVSYPPQ